MIFSTWLRNWKRSLDRRWALHQTLRRRSGVRRFAPRPRLEVLEDRLLLTAIDVTSTADINAPGTLIYAINHVNLGNYNEIDFNIGNAGSAQTINLTSQLPALTASGVTINGLTQGGPFNTKPLITLNGSGAGNSDGLLLQGSNCIVSGLILSNFGNNGIEVDGSNNIIGGTATGAGNVISGNSGDGIRIDSGVSGTQVQGNYIGTNVAGTTALANGNGIEIASANNTVGGTVAGAGNLISGNSNAGVLLDRDARGNSVLGNSIGTNLTGNGIVANGNGVEIIGSGNVVGGVTTTAGNVISGNSNDGVLIDAPSSSNLVLGNYIGINADGTAALANSGNGIDVFGIKNTVGGDVSGAGNVISGNSKDGVLVNRIASGTQVMGNYIGTNFDGTVALANSTGIEIAGINNTVGGLALAAHNLISGNGNYGVWIDFTANGNQVFGNYIGTNANGLAALPNSTGIAVFGSNNTIGGSTPAFMNLISGNSKYGVLIDSNVSGIQVLGNDIGTDQSAYGALPNSIGIAVFGSNNTIGGPDLNRFSNQISGNSSDGVLITGTGNQVLSNYIGTNIFGDRALPNSNGIEILGSDNTIGGSASGAGNLISGNGRVGTTPPNFYNTGDGVLIASSASGTQVLGNSIGVNAAGTASLNNSGTGIEIAGFKNIVGGTAAGDRNIISGNGTNTQDTQSGSDVLIDSGASGNVVLGNYVGTNAAGTAGVSSVTGIEVDGSSNTVGGAAPGAGNLISGIYDPGGGLAGLNITGSANQVLGNSIGVAAGGNIALPNNYGIGIDGSNNTIGGATAGDRNIISGNPLGGVDIWGSGNQVLGNYIGTNAAGNAAVANGTGIFIRYKGSSNTIGGTVSGAGNLISGNSTQGVLIDSTAGSGNQVLGNLIGTNVDGTGALANHIGIEIGTNNNTVGGTVSGARNVISGNSNEGVVIDSGVSGIEVLGNYIGTNAAGDGAVANGTGMYDHGTGNTVGGATPGAGNVISGNRGAGLVLAGGDLVLGNFIGTNAAGNAALHNSAGLVIGSNNTLGGAAAADRNLISGNSNDGVLINGSGNQVLGNYVGTDLKGATATGTNGKPLGNTVGLEVVGNNNTVGGTAAGAGNLVSGDSYAGLLISGQANEVLGNFIGVAGGGNSPLADGTGIYILHGSGNTIGGTASGARNLISGNSTDGVNIFGNSNQVLGNYIGTTVDGDHSLANFHNGIYVQSGSSNTIGGTASGAGNLISGNSNNGVWIDSSGSGTLVVGNSIGTNAAGTSGLGNSGNGIEVSGNNNTVGGNGSAARNLISSNGGSGVYLVGSSNQVVGNYIGTNANGDVTLGNAGYGIAIDGSNNVVGGAGSGASNLISANKLSGVFITSTASGTLVLGNSIGTNAAGTAALANSRNGIEIAGYQNTVGGTASGTRNLISGNSKDGVLIDSGASGNQVLGNSIGINLAGNAALANFNGIEIAGSGNTVGGAFSGNYISGNSNDGVRFDSGSSGNQVLGNWIGTDITGKAALANGSGIEDLGSNNTIGGTVSGAGNLISGNDLPYPNLADGVLISGSGNLVLGNSIGIDITGKTLLGNYKGIEVEGSGNTIGGTVAGAGNYISGNDDAGVQLDGSGNQVLGNYIGADVAGNSALRNIDGINVYGNNNTIGGTVSGAGNLISGNRSYGVVVGGSGSLVAGNEIGTNASGNAALANFRGIYVYSNNNTIGGTVSGARNLISGNIEDGVDLSSNGNQLLGNYIGTNASGNAALANRSTGVAIEGNNNAIGGAALGAGNLISGNKGYGVFVGGSGNQVLGNHIGTDTTGATATGTDGKLLGNYGGIEVEGSGNAIGGSASGAGNLISGNSNDGLKIDDSGSGTQVLGNYIGTNADGNAALGNSGNGIEMISSYNTVGGIASGAGNLISGNSGDGVLIEHVFLGPTSRDNLVLGNSIGINLVGNAALANSTGGLEVQGINNTIGGTDSGARNIISGNGNKADGGDGMYIPGSDNLVLGNYIGLNKDGSAALGNILDGIGIDGDNNTIGGTTPGARNVISGAYWPHVFGISNGMDIFGNGNQVLGNYIGTDATGNIALANGHDGIDVEGSNNTVGSTVSGAGNLISGNGVDGVVLWRSGSGNLVLGDYIGTNAAGTQALPNSIGIEVFTANNDTIGGTAPGAGNLISGNKTDGVVIDDFSSGNQLLGNTIGANAAGNAALGNSFGIEDRGNDNVIGGITSGARNLISGNSNIGVLFDSAGSGNLVQGNYIGTDLTGTTATGTDGKPLGNNIGIEVGGNSSNNIIGGTASGAGNLISGNTNDGVLMASVFNQVLGNSIGVAAGGNSPLANGIGIYMKYGAGNTIGGTASGARNLISGNSSEGILIGSVSYNQVLGNYIGTNANGNGPVANSIGIEIDGADNTVGGTASGASNLISGDTYAGMLISGSSNQVLGNSIGVASDGNTALADGTGIYVKNGNGNIIGGTASAARNIISGNSTDGMLVSGNDNQVLGNYIGTDYTGTLAVANHHSGIYVQSGSGNIIGGLVSGALNLISGNGDAGVKLDSSVSGTQVLGNYIGTIAAGFKPLANNIGIEIGGSGNVVGGTAAGAANLISGDTYAGVLISGDNNQVLGNSIGVTNDGNSALADGTGIYLQQCGGNIIGGTAPGARNIISGNSADGILFSGGGGNQVLGNYIGSNAAGSAAVANHHNGIYVESSSGNFIGNGAAGAGNLISGNSADGVLIAGFSNQVLGNSIGINAAGNAALANNLGIEVFSAGNTIGGIGSGARNIISGNSTYGVKIYPNGSVTQVLGNYIGTDVKGATTTGTDGKPLGNSIGIDIAANIITVGGSNLISGNSTDGVKIDSGVTGVSVLGNSIGVNAAGNAVLGNHVGIEDDGTNNTIGGTDSTSSNLISGNSSGVVLGSAGSSNQVLGNYIGTDLSGGKPLANSTGIEVDGNSNIIGGTASGARNIISGNSDAGMQIGSSGNQVLGNYIGTISGGYAALGNGAGIVLSGSSNMIGGTASGAGNLISGNDYGMSIQYGSNDNQVLGNYIGTLDGGGIGAVANSIGVFVDGSNNTIGGTASGARNIISGNSDEGLEIDGGDNQVVGNYIGTDFSGNSAVANSTGIEVAGNGNTVGGVASGAGNLISGNTNAGLLISGSADQVWGNTIGVAANGYQFLANGNGLVLSGRGNTIGGVASGTRNVISRNSNDGILISGGNDNQVLGNYIGSTPDGLASMGNELNGIEVNGSGNMIGGTASGAGNLISGNGGAGVKIDSGASGNQVLGNTIGDNPASDVGMENNLGIEVAGNGNMIGAGVAGTGNLIDANFNAMLISGSANQVLGNSILANGSGINVNGSGNTIGGTVSGARNIISGNDPNGVEIGAGTGNSVRQNSIFANGSGSTKTGPGIVLKNGSNNGVAAPSLSSAIPSGLSLNVKGTFTAATAHISYTLDFYGNPSGDAEGKVYLGSLTVTPTFKGTQEFTYTLTFATTDTATDTITLITATLTDASGNTSAFSNGVTIGSSLTSSPPPTSPPSANSPTGSSPISSSTPPLSPMQLALEVALDTAAFLLQSNATAFLELEGFSEMLLGQSLPQPSDLLSTILSDWSVSGSAGFLGLQLGINFADSVNGKTT